jgi:adiponectin receptor
MKQVRTSLGTHPQLPHWNENHLVNIYSHLFGAVLFVLLPFYTYAKVYPRYASAQLGDIIVFSTFFFGVACCFFLSASYVLRHSYSPAP